MRMSRFRGRSRGLPAFGRARLKRSTWLLLAALRWYAVIGVAIAVYAFLHAVR